MSTVCRCCCCPATCSPTAGPIRCCSRSRDFGDGTVSANDCFRPVSRYFDRIARPEQIVPALNRAIAVLTDPAECGPVTLAFCQDVQTEAYDYPESLLRASACIACAGRRRTPRELAEAVAALQRGEEAVRRLRRRRALFGGRAGTDRLLRQARHSGRRDAGRQVGDAGRPSAAHGRDRRHRHRRRQRARGGGRRRARRSARGSPISRPAPGRCSRTPSAASSASTSQPFDADKHRALPLVADARVGLAALDAALGDWRRRRAWREAAAQGARRNG